jgi:hypothetical protein
MSLMNGVINIYDCPRKNNGDIDFKPALDCYFSWHSIGYRQYAEVLKSVVINREYYAAVRETDKENGTVIVYAGIGKIEFERLKRGSSEQKFRFHYFTDRENPNYYNCPTSILKMLDEPENENARQWRMACQQHSDKKHDMFNTSNLPLGSIIEITLKSGTKDLYELRDSDFQFRKPWWCKVSEDGVYQYCPKKYVKQLENDGRVKVVRYGYGN